MADFERITVALPPQMAELVKKAVESGNYASTSEIVRDALRLWEEREYVRQRRVEGIRKAWDQGLASGIAGPHREVMDEIWRDIEAGRARVPADG